MVSHPWPGARDMILPETIENAKFNNSLRHGHVQVIVFPSVSADIMCRIRWYIRMRMSKRSAVAYLVVVFDPSELQKDC